MSGVERHEFSIQFPDSDPASAGRLVEELKDHILSAHPAVSAKISRSDQSSMDFGTTLVLLLGAPAAVAVARGIEAFLARYQSSAIRINNTDGSVVVENLTACQAGHLAEKLVRAIKGHNG